MFECVLTPRLTIGTTSPLSAAHSSNLQLTRVELSTREATREIDKSRNEKLVNRASTPLITGGGSESGREKGGREEPETKHLVDICKRATKYYNQDNHWTSRQRAKAKEVQSKSQRDQDRTEKSSAMEKGGRKSSGRRR